MNSLSKGWVYVWEQDPPSNVELLAKSPAGLVHLVSWRPAYRIFTCQCKGEYSMDWCWKLIDLDVVTWDELKVIAGEILVLQSVHLACTVCLTLNNFKLFDYES